MAQAETGAADTALDFIDALANCVHDIKNSAGVVINAADALAETAAVFPANPHVASLQTEARHINHNLMHLLGLFKLERSGCAIRRDIVDCEELIVELQAQNDPLLASRDITFLVPDADEPVEGYFDRELVGGILNAAINNAQRYARSAIRVAARIEDGYTVLSIDDDGPGYPASVLAAIGSEHSETSYRSGSTGLGLFFARRIAAMHRHRDRVGRVILSNEGLEGGARFCLSLP